MPRKSRLLAQPPRLGFEAVNKSAAGAASLDYVKCHPVIKSGASAASLCGGHAGGRLDHGFFFAIFGCASGQKIVKILDSELGTYWCRQASCCHDSGSEQPKVVADAQSLENTGLPDLPTVAQGVFLVVGTAKSYSKCKLPAPTQVDCQPSLLGEAAPAGPRSGG